MEKLLKVCVEEIDNSLHYYDLYDEKDYSILEDKILNDEELYVVDYETDFDENLRMYSVEELMELADELSSMNEYEYGHLMAYHEATGCDMFKTIQEYEDSVFYTDMTMEDVAYEYVQDLYGNNDSFLLNYFDYNSFASDLIHDGYIETEHGVVRVY